MECLVGPLVVAAGAVSILWAELEVVRRELGRQV